MVNFYDPNGESIYAEQWYDHVDHPADATLVPAAPGTVTSGIDAILPVGGTLSGTVTDTSGQPAPSVCVSAVPVDPLLPGEHAQTGSDGQYRITGLNAGSYRIEFSDCINNTLLSEWYDEQPDFASAEPVAVSLGADTGGIDAVLAAGGAITGTITDPAGNPTDLACVHAVPLDPDDPNFCWGNTNADGTYRIGALPTGDYKVEFYSCVINGPTWATQWWNNQPDEVSADIIHVDAPGKVGGIDAHLTLP